MKINSVLSFENEKFTSIEVTVTLKPLGWAEAPMKCKSPIPQAVFPAPVFLARRSWRRAKTTGQRAYN